MGELLISSSKAHVGKPALNLYAGKKVSIVCLEEQGIGDVGVRGLSPVPGSDTES